MAPHTGISRQLLVLSGTEPFAAYCRQRGIPFLQPAGTVLRPEDEQRWADALMTLPEDQRNAVELELAKVSELADPDAQGHLLAALDGKDLPCDTVPSGAAFALWVLLHEPVAFHEVFLQRELQEVDSWRVARARAGLPINTLRDNGPALAKSLQKFFGLEGIGRYCTIDIRPLGGACCFLVSIADRVQLFKSFTETGEHTTKRLWPAVPVTFVYYPQDGTLLLESRQRSEDRIFELFQRFSRTVLGMELTKNDLGQRFALDRLKTAHHLLPDAEDMTLVRVKALHLRYPPQQGRRQLKLETLAGDEPSAISQLLRSHVGGQGFADQLHVSYAELQVRLRTEGRSRSHVIRLWANRSNLPQSPLGERLRRCLTRWDLLHAHES